MYLSIMPWRWWQQYSLHWWYIPIRPSSFTWSLLWESEIAYKKMIC